MYCFLFYLQCDLKYFFESAGDSDGNAFARKLNAHVRGPLVQNKWYRFEHVMVGVSNDGDLVLTYNITSLDEAESFKGLILDKFQCEFPRELASLISRQV